MFLGLIIWPWETNWCALSWGVVPLLLPALPYIFNSLWRTRALWTFLIQFGMFSVSSLFSSHLVIKIGDTLHVLLLKFLRGKNLTADSVILRLPQSLHQHFQKCFLSLGYWSVVLMCPLSSITHHEVYCS